MDPSVLCQILEGTLNIAEETRRHSEEQLKALESEPGFAVTLLAIAAEPRNGLAVNQAAAVCLKNFVLSAWRSPKISDADKNALFTQLIPTLAEVQEPLVARYAPPPNHVAHGFSLSPFCSHHKHTPGP